MNLCVLQNDKVNLAIKHVITDIADTKKSKLPDKEFFWPMTRFLQYVSPEEALKAVAVSSHS